MWNTRQRLLVFRALSIGLSCGLPVRQCLATAGGGAWLEPVLQQVGDGTPLSVALVGCLPATELAQIREGERCGALAQTFKSLRGQQHQVWTRRFRRLEIPLRVGALALVMGWLAHLTHGFDRRYSMPNLFSFWGFGLFYAGVLAWKRSLRSCDGQAMTLRGLMVFSLDACLCSSGALLIEYLRLSLSCPCLLGDLG